MCVSKKVVVRFWRGGWEVKKSRVKGASGRRLDVVGLSDSRRTSEVSVGWSKDVL